MFYQWRTLVPTYEKRLTKIQDIYISDVTLDSAYCISHIEGQPEAPICNVYLKNIKVANILNIKVNNTNVSNFNLKKR